MNYGRGHARSCFRVQREDPWVVETKVLGDTPRATITFVGDRPKRSPIAKAQESQTIRRIPDISDQKRIPLIGNTCQTNIDQRALTQCRKCGHQTTTEGAAEELSDKVMQSGWTSSS
jgi:hypothetical protein